MTRGKLDDDIVRILRKTADCQQMTEKVFEFLEVYNNGDVGNEMINEAGDLVDDDDDAAVTVRVTTLNLMVITTEVNYEGEIV